MNNFKESLNPDKYGFSKRDVDKYMRKRKEELAKIPLETLNELCKVCGGICNGNISICSIGAAIHEKDKDNVDILGDSKFNRYIPEK